MEVGAKIAQYLLETQAVKLSPGKPFTWTSGLLSPIYCDNRVCLSFPLVREYITDTIVSKIKEKFNDLEAIVGVATAGIPQGALVSSKMNLPFAYIRPEPKKHGMKNALEGKLNEKSKVVVIEDLISTGKSSLKAIETLRELGFEVLGMVSIFEYGFISTKEIFKEKNCEYYSLSNFSILLNEAFSQKYIDEKQFNDLKNWNQNHQEWSDKKNNFLS